MKRRTWYHIALFLPFILPITLGALGLLASQVMGKDFLISKILMGTFSIIALPMLIESIPYFFFVLAVMWWVNKKGLSADAMKRASWFLPLLFIPVSPIGALYFSKDPSFLTDPLRMYADNFWISLIFVPIYGYFYVALTHGLTRCLQKCRLVRD